MGLLETHLPRYPNNLRKGYGYVGVISTTTPAQHPDHIRERKYLAMWGPIPGPDTLPERPERFTGKSHSTGCYNRVAREKTSTSEAPIALRRWHRFLTHKWSPPGPSGSRRNLDEGAPPTSDWAHRWHLGPASVSDLTDVTRRLVAVFAADVEVPVSSQLAIHRKIPS